MIIDQLRIVRKFIFGKSFIIELQHFQNSSSVTCYWLKTRFDVMKFTYIFCTKSEDQKVKTALIGSLRSRAVDYSRNGKMFTTINLNTV